MENWSELKKPFKELKDLSKEIFKGIFSIVSTKSNTMLKQKPLKAVIASNCIVFGVMFCFAFYWFAKYKVLSNNECKQSYTESQLVDSAKLDAEIEAREEVKEIYKDRIDSLEEALIEAKTANKPRRTQYTRRYPSAPTVTQPKQETPQNTPKQEPQQTEIAH